MQYRESYNQKFERIAGQTLFGLLKEKQQNFIRRLAHRYRFTMQELRQVVEACRDLDMWGEESLENWWLSHFPEPEKDANLRQLKQARLQNLQAHLYTLRTMAKSYDQLHPSYPKYTGKKIVVKESDKNIFGWCPVASEKTVCCNLRTIDAVEGCAFGCSYCTIQTFYREEYVFDAHLKDKLQAIDLDAGRFYHIGTGQSSDSLIWGNRNGLLDDLVQFARQRPNVLLELKTKSDNIDYFLDHDVPQNIFCSWSLNPQEIIDREEYYTAGLEARLRAARAVADKGMKVSFHFHPIIYYDHWHSAYPAIARRIMQEFDPQEILFISFGSVTFIKPVIKKIRATGISSKILQMNFVSDPHGKLTYADDIKIEKFTTMYQTFSPWHDRVFFYLCMEKASIWERSLGYVYTNNEEFERELIRHSVRKMDPLKKLLEAGIVSLPDEGIKERN